MKKAAKYFIIVLVFAVLGGGDVYFLVTRPRANPGAAGASAEPSVNVVVQTVATATLPDVILLPASVEPEKSVTVASETMGKVESLSVAEGAVVKEGQEIARVDTRTLDAELDTAKANHEQARADYDRAQKLFDQKAMSQEQFDQYKAKLAVLKAALEMAQVAFEKGTITAPAGGILNKRFVEKGEYVKPGDDIAQIVKVDVVKVVSEVPEKDIGYVATGSVLGVVLDGAATDLVPETAADQDLASALKQAVADKKITLGTVTYRSVVADEKTRTYRVEVTVPNAELNLLPGRIVRVILLRRMIPNAISVPLVAVVPREGRAVVYVEEGGRARERTVSLGISDGRSIEVTKGLAPGDRLIIEGQRQLREGTLVRFGGNNAGKAVEAGGDAAAPASADAPGAADASKDGGGPAGPDSEGKRQ